MSDNINLRQGLNIPISGAAAQKTSKNVASTVIAIKPTDFKGLMPRLLVREGDAVQAGSPVLADKVSPEILFTSPVSGTVAEVVRGEKRKLLEVRIKADDTQNYVDFGVKKVNDLNADQIREALLQSGLWPAFIQRPYGILANPQIKPKAIFVSAFSTAPLAADTEYALREEFDNIQTGVNAIAKLTDGGVHFSLNQANYSGTPFHKIENVIQHTFSGKHPAGNVGIQIHHISPIRKGETVWTVSLMMLAAIGKLFNTGKYDLTRKVAVTGPRAIDPCYVNAVPGMSMKDIAEFYDNSKGDIRFISGDVLTGTNVGAEGFLGFYDNQVSLIKEGNEYEMFGWCKPFRTNLFSASRAYFSWLTPNKRYDMDTNLHGGERAFLMSDVYGKVLPMDIFPVHLIKACLAGNIDKMEELGIYEVLDEDLALCEYVCPSKIEWMSILNSGIDLMLKEMA
ncbi:MAG: Na(+)-translocating NADH-quinone reductase subunit A [Bacteroidales bacterium]|nr:Na(+)-translocating NADH-quinone reductase subunit A [Bacteroides sp.]MCM1197675.1 Na(+)-translocating NADH-quinone reductase subunit A [Clostridium sp.]MCM1501895.1 Na(+)-translocating NADH-quinone reductase subunit A [Bacteroidales bacterium]